MFQKKKLNFQKIEMVVSKMSKSDMNIIQNDDNDNSDNSDFTFSNALNTKKFVKNDLKNNYDTLYNKMSKISKAKTPFKCITCDKGSYTKQCVKCMMPEHFVEEYIKAEENEIKVDITKTITEQHEERIEENKKINNNNNRMKIEDILKIKLRNKSKLPINSWTDKRNQSKTFKADSSNNVGIVCNESSGVFALDLDFYSKEGKEDYDPINNPNHKLFIDKFSKDFIKRFDTYTQITPNGGIHLLFKHEEGLFQTQNDKYKIDTRGGDTNGYIVGFGSKVNGKEYIVKLNQDIKPIPKDLKQFLQEVVFVDTDTKISVSNKSQKSKVLKSIKSHSIPQNYSYNFTDAELRIIIEKIPRNYFTDFSKWLLFTSGMKQINRKDLWKEYSKKFGNSQYDEKQNDYYWNKTKNKKEECMYLEHLMKKANCLEFINLSKYKPQPESKNTPDIEINMPYLTGNKTSKGYSDSDTDCIQSYKDGFDYEKSEHIIIQSDTGTAKSSSFKEYVKNSGESFISIVSRISLAREQYEDFIEDEINCDFYQYGLDNTNQGAIICIDSIMKLRSWDWCGELENRVIFLDEFNSLVEYCLNTTTMNNKRMEVFEFLVNNIFMKAKKIICADADISDISMKFINYIKEKRGGFTYYKNTHIHNKDTPATEIYSKEALVNKISNEETYFLATDSKREAVDIYQQLIKKNPKKPIKLIVARDDTRKDSEEHIDLKNEPRVIYSPKIVYGNDSNGFKGEFKRPVYTYYTGMTISPTAMFQQINRERKISHLYYCFENKDFASVENKTTKEILERFEKEQKDACDLIGRGTYNEDIEKMFIDLFVDLMIKQDTYNTNKYVHFKILLPKRGFKDTRTEKKQTKKQDCEALLIKKMRVNKFNSENFNVGDALNSQLNQDVLHITNTELIRKNKALFCESGKAEKFIKAKAFYINNEKYASKMLKNEDDMEFKKINGKYGSIVYLQQVYETLGYTPTFEKKEEVKQIEKNEIVSNYKKFCRGKISEEDLITEQKKKAFLFKITKSILGEGWITNKQKREGKKRIVEYKFNKSKLNNIKKIVESKRPLKLIDPTTKEFTDYYRKYRKL